MTSADLSNSSLEKANLSEANLINANLKHADLKNTILNDANIENTDFQNAFNLTPEQVKSTKNWEKAKYDRDFRAALNSSMKEDPSKA